ncbi:hypothetical protein PsYK624_106730 [Phanerochaete sordida]|uniref:Uncharacterized protein n=1 Tax=Phanerochaete sordida TaxID=48140 RepID=A0A9P3GEB6_9APHY|nr:hypothetical protein PsYK624_106730 [Phanerochaete sordida]
MTKDSLARWAPWLHWTQSLLPIAQYNILHVVKLRYRRIMGLPLFPTAVPLFPTLTPDQIEFIGWQGRPEPEAHIVQDVSDSVGQVGAGCHILRPFPLQGKPGLQQEAPKGKPREWLWASRRYL